MKLTSKRWEVRLHLPDLIAMTADPTDPLSRESVGMLNIEPNGSVYKDPKTGALTDGAGTLTDIIVNQSLPNHSAAPGFIPST